MGNRTTTAQKLDHARLGSVTVLEQDGKQYMQYIVSVHHDQAEKQWEKALEDLRGKKEFQCMFLPHSYEVEKVPCGISRNLKVLYPFFPYSLKEQIANRIQMETPFEQKQLQYLLFQLLDLAKEYEKQGKKMGNVKPDNILINNDGEVSIICRWSYPGFQDGYTSALYDKEPSFLAPEEMKHLETGDEEAKVDQNKAQAFSIGMTILSAGLLDLFQGLYSFKHPKFDEALLKDKLLAWKQDPKFSGFFKLVVEKLLSVDPSERFSPGEMRAYLSPYEDAIKTLQPYQANYQLSETYLQKYKQSKLTKKPSGSLNEGEPVKGIRQLGAKFSRRESKDSSQFEKTATKIVDDRLGSSSFANSAKTSKDQPSFMTSLPTSQYVVQKPMVSFIPINHTYTHAPINFTYATNHHPFVYPQQPPQPLVGDLPRSSFKQTNSSVQQILKEFKAQLSGQKDDKDLGLSPEANHNQSIQENRRQ